MSAPTRPRHPILGFFDIAVAAMLLYAVWEALPSRWLPVDVGVTILAGLLVVSGVALLIGARLARRLGIVVGAVALAVGATLCTLLLITGTELVGLYGPVGRGAAIILSISAFLIVPYLVALPAAQIYILLGAKGR